MSSFSVTEAAFEGFRITRERPWAVLGWILAYFVFTLAISMLATVWGVGHDLVALRTLALTPDPDLHEMARMFARLAPYAFVTLTANVLFFAIVVCAIYRVVLRPFEPGLDFLRLGSDELRMIGLALILVFLAMGGFFAAVLASSLAAVTLGTFGGALGGLAGFLIVVGSGCAAVWAGVRLSLAAPMTFSERRLIVFSAWSFTRSSFWPLLLAYALAILFGLVVWLLLGLISGVAFQAAGGSQAMLTTLAAPTKIEAFLTAPALVAWALGATGIVALWVILISPSAIAYQALANAALQPGGASKPAAWS
jgi:hypothetical protein